MTIRLLLADDHRMFREGLRALLAGQRDLEIVGEAGDGLEAVALARRLAPRVVVMDVEMPLLNGLEATRQIHTELPGVRVVILSMHDDRRFVIEALRAGATGYLLKHCAFEDLAHAVRAAAAGQSTSRPASRALWSRTMYVRRQTPRAPPLRARAGIGSELSRPDLGQICSGRGSATAGVAALR